MNFSKLFRQLFVFFTENGDFSHFFIFSDTEKIMFNPICLDKTYDSSLFCLAIAPCFAFSSFFQQALFNFTVDFR